MRDIPEGSPAPAFDMPTDDGGRVSLDDLKGKSVVLYFYPKADTPGCTNEGKDFTAMKTAFARKGAVVIEYASLDELREQEIRSQGHLHRRHQPIGQHAGEGEERIGHAFGRHLYDVAEDDRENDHREQRLQNGPAGAEQRLLIKHLQVAHHEHAQEFAVTPDGA